MLAADVGDDLPILGLGMREDQIVSIVADDRAVRRHDEHLQPVRIGQLFGAGLRRARHSAQPRVTAKKALQGE